MSDKIKYPTFARTGVYADSISATIQTLLNHFKWKHVGVIYEKTLFFKKVYHQFKTKLNGTITAVKSIPPTLHYTYDHHYELAKNDLQNVSKAARSKLFYLKFLLHFKGVTTGGAKGRQPSHEFESSKSY